MLPEGFQWQHYLDGPALYLEGRMAALCTPVDNGRWRVTVGVGLKTLRHEFVGSEDAARRYVEAWARKWQEQIRDGSKIGGRPSWGKT